MVDLKLLTFQKTFQNDKVLSFTNVGMYKLIICTMYICYIYVCSKDWFCDIFFAL